MLPLDSSNYYINTYLAWGVSLLLIKQSFKISSPLVLAGAGAAALFPAFLWARGLSTPAETAIWYNNASEIAHLKSIDKLE